MSEVGIFWVDPGVSTGLAWGIFDNRADTVVDAMRGRERSGSATITCGGAVDIPAIRYHADQVYLAYMAFEKDIKSWCDRIVFGMEHFILTPGPHTPGVEGIFPAFLVGAIATEMSIIEANAIELQSASVGMRFNTRTHLERYEAWVRGREHERAAFAHIAAYLMKTIR